MTITPHRPLTITPVDRVVILVDHHAELARRDGPPPAA